jgi:hypothetical protein
MRRVILESPFAGVTEQVRQSNITYARAALKDCLMRGEAPFASHLLYTQVLEDLIPSDRKLGIEAGLVWGEVAEATVVYTDHGISSGMEKGIEHAKTAGRPIEYRSIK